MIRTVRITYEGRYGRSSQRSASAGFRNGKGAVRGQRPHQQMAKKRLRQVDCRCTAWKFCDRLAMRLLVVEDDPTIAEPLRAGLEREGFEVNLVGTGADALAAEPAELVLLDLGLPDLDGRVVCQELRKTSDVPIIVVTARGDEIDRVMLLELGADDYVVKPFGFRELVARIRAVTRRATAAAAGARGDVVEAVDVIDVGPLRVDRRTHRVTLTNDREESELALTPKEFELLSFLAEDAGAVRSRTEIIEHVWDANWFGPTKTVDAHVAGLRRKLGDARWIAAVRGVGFRLETPEP